MRPVGAEIINQLSIITFAFLEVIFLKVYITIMAGGNVMNVAYALSVNLMYLSWQWISVAAGIKMLRALVWIERHFQLYSNGFLGSLPGFKT
ncbi:MAG: hypothetical protein A6F70_10555 [Cycloclasticus sp. symbiont of Bathymodiolus heckerae]|nr:MAG: hypothetical protein A6F70_10555 [Cycloclasticus sp. symbiont of Bathymodiolus heckerae]